MIIDTSAIVAAIRGEPSAPAVLDALVRSDSCRMSAGTALELAIVLDNSGEPRLAGAAEALLRDAGTVIDPVTAEQVAVARQAYRDYGKGRHPAGLNFGDCFAYALAKVTGEPLAFVGEDFAKTDIDPAIPA